MSHSNQSASVEQIARLKAAGIALQEQKEQVAAREKAVAARESEVNNVAAHSHPRSEACAIHPQVGERPWETPGFRWDKYSISRLPGDWKRAYDLSEQHKEDCIHPDCLHDVKYEDRKCYHETGIRYNDQQTRCRNQLIWAPVLSHLSWNDPQNADKNDDNISRNQFQFE